MGVTRAFVVVDPEIGARGVAAPILESMRAAGVTLVEYGDVDTEPSIHAFARAVQAAREAQVDLEGRLQPAERSGLDHDAAGFQPNAPASADLATLVPPAETLAETQALLARKGYYVGPVDGVATPALKTAAAAYLRDHPQAIP